MGECFLSFHRPHFFENFRWQGFRYPPNFYLRAGNGFGSRGYRFCHFIDMSICRIKNNENFHGYFLLFKK
jgi:hypothetical protein